MNFPGTRTLSVIFTMSLFCMAPELTAQGRSGSATGSNGQPLEFIESSSPVPGGGVVTSVYTPSGATPVYRQSSTTDSVPQSSQGQSVLDPGLSQAGGNRMSVPTTAARVAARPPQLLYQNPVNNQPPAASQIPSLGVPTNWNRSIRTVGCNSCGPGAGHTPYGFVQQPPAVYGAQAPVVAQSPQAVFGQPQRAVYTPLIQLQSFPPNAYAGQGIIGSPKLYVDGQPVRNLLRYLWIP